MTRVTCAYVIQKQAISKGFPKISGILGRSHQAIIRPARILARFTEVERTAAFVGADVVRAVHEHLEAA